MTIEGVRALPEEQQTAWWKSLTPAEADAFLHDWNFLARDEQLPPDGLWTHWLYLAGRGAGKTRTGAETARQKVKEGCKRLGLIAPTSADARDVMIEGEALALDTPIPTPMGWSTIKELSPGDKIFTGNGEVTTVVAKSPVCNVPCAAVKVRHSEPIIASLNHLWVTQTWRERDDNIPHTTRTTQEISDTVEHFLETNHSVPDNPVLMLPEKDLPIPPYTYGIVACGPVKRSPRDTELREGIEEDGYHVNRPQGRTVLEMVLPELPPVTMYLRASRLQRIAAVQGMMDACGEIDTYNTCLFHHKDIAVVELLRQLLLTLGVQPRVASRNITGFRASFTPFRIKRYVDRLPKEYRYMRRTIRSVEPAKTVPTQCIEVAHPSGTFLCGRDYVVTHNSGVLAISWDNDFDDKGVFMGKPLYEPSKRRLTWQNGAIATLYSADEPERLRGPQHDYIWADELCSWRRPETWDLAMFGLRLGVNPQAFISTTPKPKKLIMDLLKDPNCSVTKGSTYDNRANLAANFFKTIITKYEGTRLGQQELMGVVLEESEGALWSRTVLDKTRRKDFDLTLLVRIVVAVDPAITSNSDSNECGIVVAGIDAQEHAYVLEDYSGVYTPAAWAKKAVNAYKYWGADRIVAEGNQGGEMVKHTIRTEDRTAPVKIVHASRGKMARAEPVAALFEQNTAHMVGDCPDLEDQLCVWEPLSGIGSPDRLDAMVWALTDLTIGKGMTGQGKLVGAY